VNHHRQYFIHFSTPPTEKLSVGGGWCLWRYEKYKPVSTSGPALAANETAALARPGYAVFAAGFVSAVPVAVAFGPVGPVVAALAFGDLD
jgi:hypothetical protein